ncbi:DUF4393 domain-containing protein [Metabacillus fastidiosus]|uniref:DUF4393 domain-containing protein n=1 Tax=Metabacillus fastidiosus TaxID=1458 RepID=UPI003D2A112C
MDILNATKTVVDLTKNSESPPIKTFNNLWYFTFGKFDLFVDKMRIKHQKDRQEYEKEILLELSSIPEQNLIEPTMGIVGPALEASKFHIGEPELRKMFAKVIAASMDERMFQNVHHSFVEIIKQLSPLDAQNLNLFKNEESHVLPIAEFALRQDPPGTGFTILARHIFLSNKNCQDINIAGMSITNLLRLGLIEIDYARIITREGEYDIFETHPYYIENKTKYGTIQYPKDPKLVDKFFYNPGIARFSPLGKMFINACL